MDGKKNKSHASEFTRAVKKDWDLYLMLFFPFCLLVLFKYIPMGGLIMAFQDFDIFEGFIHSPMVGFANFQELFSQKEFLSVLLNTLSISWYKILFFLPSADCIGIGFKRGEMRMVQTHGADDRLSPAFFILGCSGRPGF